MLSTADYKLLSQLFIYVFFDLTKCTSPQLFQRICLTCLQCSFLSPLSHLAELHLNIKVSTLVEQHGNVTHILFVSRLRVFPSCDSRAQAKPGLLWSPRKAR